MNAIFLLWLLSIHVENNVHVTFILYIRIFIFHSDYYAVHIHSKKLSHLKDVCLIGPIFE